MKNNIFAELDEFFMEREYTEDQIAKFFLIPNEVEYYQWQLEKFKRLYVRKELRPSSKDMEF